MHYTFYTCGKCLQSSQRTRELDKNNYDVLSIPGYVIKKNTIRGAQHGPSERKRMYHKAKEMLQKALQPKNGGHKSILGRWHKDDQYRNSLSLIGWTEEQINAYDKIALKAHSNVATNPEIIQNTKYWVLRLNQDGAQQPLTQRPDFGQAKKRMQKNARRQCEKDSTRK